MRTFIHFLSRCDASGIEKQGKDVIWTLVSACKRKESKKNGRSEKKLYARD